ncbi:MAG TPA: lactate utilization protein [Rectinemataceae bacterium]|nr:lactate utilization protein [Rectinemataceae bacterium]
MKAVEKSVAPKSAPPKSAPLPMRIASDMAKTLRSRGFAARAFENRDKALNHLFGLAPEGSTVGLGGSMTLTELGVVEKLRSGPWRLIDRYAAPDWDATMAAYREALLADVFITGVNAITRKGELVCTDSSGNRVAAMIFGPTRVIVVAGINKIVEDLDEAFARIRTIAPLNCRRLGHKTPCAETGICADCMTPQRMCNYTGIIHDGLKEKDRIHVILLAEALGY